MTISELNNILTALAKSSYLVNEAFTGDVYNIDFKENKFGCFVATPMTGVKNDGTITYNYTLYYVDRLTKNEDNIDFVQSDAVRVLKGVINFLEEHSIEVEDGYQITLFRHQFDDWCAGAYVEVNLTIPDGECDDEFNLSGELRHLIADRNGIYIPEGFDGYDKVVIDVPQAGATEEWVDEEIDRKLEDYASIEWVRNQGYVDEEELNERLELYATLSDVNYEINRIDETITTIQSDITSVESDITTIQSDITSIESNITTIQSDITTIQSDITSIESNITTIQSDITTIQSDITSIESNITTIQSDITSIESNITTIQSDITTIQSDITTIQSDITSIESDISTIQSDITRIDEELSNNYASKTWVEEKGYLTEETDPIFTASPAHSITTSNISSWNGKFDASLVWTGTAEEWDELTTQQKESYTIALITS